MPTPTYSELLATFKSALNAVSSGQSYTMQDGRSLTRADIAEIRRTIDWLETKVNSSDTSDDETGTGFALVRFI